MTRGSRRVARRIEVRALTRKELVEAVARRRGIPRRTAERVVATVLAAVSDALCRGERVELRGFGTFRARHYPPYVGRNPRTSTRVDVGRKVLPVFKPGRELARRVGGESGGGEE